MHAAFIVLSLVFVADDAAPGTPEAFASQVDPSVVLRIREQRVEAIERLQNEVKKRADAVAQARKLDAEERERLSAALAEATAKLEEAAKSRGLWVPTFAVADIENGDICRFSHGWEVVQVVDPMTVVLRADETNFLRTGEPTEGLKALGELMPSASTYRVKAYTKRANIDASIKFELEYLDLAPYLKEDAPKKSKTDASRPAPLSNANKAGSALRLAKQVLAAGKTSAAQTRLEKIVKDFLDSAEATEAAKLLEGL